MRCLLEKGANVDEVCGAGTTALRIAIQRGDVSSVRLLLDHNASVAIRLLHGHTPLTLAAKKGST